MPFPFWNRTINIIWNTTRNKLDNSKDTTIPKPQDPHPWCPGSFPRLLHNLPSPITQLQIKAVGSRLCYTWPLKLMSSSSVTCWVYPHLSSNILCTEWNSGWQRTVTITETSYVNPSIHNAESPYHRFYEKKKLLFENYIPLNLWMYLLHLCLCLWVLLEVGAEWWCHLHWSLLLYASQRHETIVPIDLVKISYKACTWRWNWSLKSKFEKRS